MDNKKSFLSGTRQTRYERNMSDRKNLVKEIFLLFGIMTAVFFIAIYHINESNGIKVYGDEVGYWQNAALLAGMDWSGEASLNVYYGYGYGFLLMPILLIFNKNPASMMHAAIIFQGIMLASCVAASWLILRKLNVNIDWKCKSAILLFSVLYPANIFYTKFTLCEILLTTCIWWLTCLALYYIKSKRKIQAVGILLLSVYMFSIHQRMLTVVLSGFVLILFVSISKQKRTKGSVLKVFLSLVLIFTALLFICKVYDEYYTSSLYSLATDGGQEVNRVSTGAKNVLRNLLSIEWIISIGISFCGKLFYSFVGTYGFVLIGFFACITFIIKYMKEKKLDNVGWYLYLFLNYLMAIGTASLAMGGGFAARSDLLMYGRYSEFTYGPILLSGIIYLYTRKRQNAKEFFGGMVVILLMCLICLGNTYDNAPNPSFWVQCTALADLKSKTELTNKEVVLIAALRCIGIMGILVLIEICAKKLKIKLTSILLALVILLWAHTANVNWNKNLMSWYEPLETAMYDIVSGMEEEDVFLTLDATLSGCMQFLLPNIPLRPCASIEEVAEYGKENYIITNVGSEYVPYIREHYIVDKENERYLRWKYK